MNLPIVVVVVVVVVTARAFDFTNGFPNTANAMATSIATGALWPKVAVPIAGSTTDLCTGSIFGAGAGRRPASVHWGAAGQMALSLVVTLPAAGAVAAWAARGAVGTVVVAVVGIAMAAGIYAAARRRPATAHNVNDLATAGAEPVGASA
jgi:PiT family inorganic phosphate transporter